MTTSTGVAGFFPHATAGTIAATTGTTVVERSARSRIRGSMTYPAPRPRPPRPHGPRRSLERMTLPDSTYKLEGISPRAFQHPADRAATAALTQVPYLDQAVRKLIDRGYERALRQAMLGSAVRLGQEQLPRIWVLEREVFHALDVDDVPDMCMTQFPIANALTFGTGRPVIVLGSPIVRLLDADGLRVVIAHEGAHVLSGHVLYQ